MKYLIQDGLVGFLIIVWLRLEENNILCKSIKGYTNSRIDARLQIGDETFIASYLSDPTSMATPIALISMLKTTQQNRLFQCFRPLGFLAYFYALDYSDS